MANGNPDVLQRLRDVITTLTTSDNWTRYLDVQRKFHHYSWGNCILIAMQRPDATRVAGYRSWQNLGRQVRRGERGISIIAPIAYKNRVEDANTETLETRTLRGFRAVPVFDVSQTDGKPLPEILHRLSGDDPVFAFRRLQVVASDMEYQVSVEDLPGTRNGDCNFSEKIIRLRPGLEPAQTVKTLAHELGHAFLHHPDHLGERSMTRDLAELEAESIAYVICQELGIDSSDYTFG